MFRILSASSNTRLLLTRNNALAIAGYTVASPRIPEETLLLLTQQRFDAVILGHSIEPEKRRMIIEQVRANAPEAVIVFVYVSSESIEEPLADFSVDVTSGPEPLIRALEERLLPKPS